MQKHHKEKIIDSIETPLTENFGTPNPKHSEWISTRPGGLQKEILHYSHKTSIADISILKHFEGEVDEDGYEWKNDCYEIIVHYEDGAFEGFVYMTERDTAEKVTELMIEISNSTTPTQE